MMDFKDYYAVLGLDARATPDQIKRAYRKLARKYHPDVSKEADAEARFKDLAEAYEALGDVDKRAAYDALSKRQTGGREFSPPPGWNAGFDFSGADIGSSGHSAFFDALFGQAASGRRGGPQADHARGGDQHAQLEIDLIDAYRGGRRSLSLRLPQIDAQGRMHLQDRHLDVNIPKGVRAGQHLRLVGQGNPGNGELAAGDLYLEIQFAPHPLFRVDQRDVYVDLPVTPWEAMLGASLTVPTPDGSVQMSLPPASTGGRKLRLRGKGLPGSPPGDFYAVLSIVLPPADSLAERQAYQTMAAAFTQFNPRSTLLEA